MKELLLSLARALHAAGASLEADAAQLESKSGDVLVTLDEAATALDVSKRTLFEWLKLGMPSVKRGVRRRVDLAAVREWLDGRGVTR